MMRPRPVSLTIFGVLNIGYALMMMVSVVIATALPHLVPGHAHHLALRMAQNETLLLTKVIFGLAVGLALMISGVGLLLARNWGRVGSIACAAVDVAVVLAESVISWRASIEQVASLNRALPRQVFEISYAMGIVIGLAYPVLLLIFMNQPGIIEACKPEEPSAAAQT